MSKKAKAFMMTMIVLVALLIVAVIAFTRRPGGVSGTDVTETNTINGEQDENSNEDMPADENIGPDIEPVTNTEPNAMPGRNEMPGNVDIPNGNETPGNAGEDAEKPGGADNTEPGTPNVEPGLAPASADEADRALRKIMDGGVPDGTLLRRHMDDMPSIENEVPTSTKDATPETFPMPTWMPTGMTESGLRKAVGDYMREAGYIEFPPPSMTCVGSYYGLATDGSGYQPSVIYTIDLEDDPYMLIVTYDGSRYNVRAVNDN